MKRYELNLNDTIEKVITGFPLQTLKSKRGAIVTVAENNKVNVYVFISCGDETLVGMVTDRHSPECNFVVNDDSNVEFQN